MELPGPEWHHRDSPIQVTPLHPLLHRPSMDLFEIISTDSLRKFSAVQREAEVKCIFSQIVDGVHHMAERGYAHGDIKDENILVIVF